MNGQNGSKLDADLLTPAEIELLMRQCSRRAPTGVRNRALIAVLWRCGLRIGEALALRRRTSTRTRGRSSSSAGRAASGASWAWTPARSRSSAAGSRLRRKRGIAAGRSSARSRGGRWTSRTSGTCCRGSRARPGWSAGCTRTGSATPSRSTSSARARPSTSCGTRSATHRRDHAGVLDPRRCPRGGRRDAEPRVVARVARPQVCAMSNETRHGLETCTSPLWSGSCGTRQPVLEKLRLEPALGSYMRESRSSRSAAAIASGDGGQPGIRASTGSRDSTGPTISSSMPSTLQPRAQSPSAATSRGSGIAA